MTVTEYRDRFLQLARYAPAEVAYDRDKQEHFMEGLEDYIQYVLLNLRFDDFNHLVDSALNTERKHREMEDKKRKITTVASSSNRRGRARGYRHLRLVLLHRHRRLHVRQLLPDSRLRDLLAPAFTAASRGTTPTLAPGRRRRDSRGAQLSPGRHFRAE